MRTLTFRDVINKYRTTKNTSSVSELAKINPLDKRSFYEGLLEDEDDILSCKLSKLIAFDQERLNLSLKNIGMACMGLLLPFYQYRSSQLKGQRFALERFMDDISEMGKDKELSAELTSILIIHLRDEGYSDLLKIFNKPSVQTMTPSRPPAEDHYSEEQSLLKKSN